MRRDEMKICPHYDVPYQQYTCPLCGREYYACPFCRGIYPCPDCENSQTTVIWENMDDAAGRAAEGGE